MTVNKTRLPWILSALLGFTPLHTRRETKTSRKSCILGFAKNTLWNYWEQLKRYQKKKETENTVLKVCVTYTSPLLPGYRKDPSRVRRRGTNFSSRTSRGSDINVCLTRQDPRDPDGVGALRSSVRGSIPQDIIGTSRNFHPGDGSQGYRGDS